MQRKEYKLPNGKTAVFEYDACEIGKITLECMDELMSMIADRPQGEWIEHWYPHFDVAGIECSICGKDVPYWERNYDMPNFCPNCGADMRGDNDYERAIEQMEHDMLYEPTYNSEDGSM